MILVLERDKAVVLNSDGSVCTTLDIAAESYMEEERIEKMERGNFIQGR